MKTFHTVQELREALTSERQHGHRIALVPTMGNLHEGHISLVEAAKQHADIIVATVFVNPLQFGPNEDLDTYPRTLDADKTQLSAAGCHYLLAPSVEEVYPDGQATQTQVSVPGVTELYCGASRPGHFDGVTTVVCKLFGMVQPDVALFGEKDFQQLFVIRKMTRDLCMPIDIVGVPIKRNAKGLALSSRNGYLSKSQLETATILNQTLKALKDQLIADIEPRDQLLKKAQEGLEAAGFTRDYLVLARQSDLQPAQPDDTDLVILAAAFMGQTRLIDNIAFRL
jgi:pantoate--beta-alanine ligase